MESHSTGHSFPARGREPDTTPVEDLRYPSIPASAERLSAVRHALVDWAAYAGLTTEDAEALGLSSYEAMANVVEHAYTDGEGGISLAAVQVPGENRVEVSVTDHGEWAAPSTDRAMAGHGLGLPLIRRLAEEADVATGPEGTIVRMSWSLPPRR